MAGNALPTPVMLATPDATSVTRSSKAADTGGIELLPARSRFYAKVVNDGTATMKIGEGPVMVTLTDFSEIVGPGLTYYTSAGFNGRITAIWDTANGSARITEYA